MGQDSDVAYLGDSSSLTEMQLRLVKAMFIQKPDWGWMMAFHVAGDLRFSE